MDIQHESTKKITPIRQKNISNVYEQNFSITRTRQKQISHIIKHNEIDAEFVELEKKLFFLFSIDTLRHTHTHKSEQKEQNTGTLISSKINITKQERTRGRTPHTGT